MIYQVNTIQNCEHGGVMDSSPASHADTQGSNPKLTLLLPDERNFVFFVHFDQFLVFKFKFFKILDKK